MPNADGKGRASLSYYVCMYVQERLRTVEKDLAAARESERIAKHDLGYTYIHNMYMCVCVCVCVLYIYIINTL